MKASGWHWLVWGMILVVTGCKPPPAGSGGGGAAGMAMQVVAIAARHRPVTESVSLVGTLAANESVELKAETDGIVQEILFDEGQEVEAGALLLRLDETRLAAALEEAEASFKLSRATFDRNKQLLTEKLVSQQEYDQASALFELNRATVEKRRRELKDTRVYAPFHGRTGARTVSPGQVITRNTVLTSLVDLDPMKVEMQVPERFLSQTRVGQKISFEVAAHPGRRFEGEIYFIASQLDLRTRAALVKTRIPNPEGLLRAGMVANLELRFTIREQAVMVPEVALVSNANAVFVFVVDAERKAQLRPVTIGQRVPRWVEVAAGLQAGELVVVEGHQKIGPGMPVVLAPPEKAAVYETTELRR